MREKTPALSRALWSKCPACNHCWPAAYYPIDLSAMGRLLKGAKCPKGCRQPPVLAKQNDGELLEPSEFSTPAPCHETPSGQIEKAVSMPPTPTNGREQL